MSHSKDSYGPFEADQNVQRHVFLSYCREDAPAARQVKDAMEKDGLSVFWDQDIPVGEPWDAALEDALDGATAVVVLWTLHSVQSDAVKEEARRAERSGKLRPVQLEAVELPMFLSHVQAADLTSWEGDRGHAGYRRLLAALRSAVAAPTDLDFRRQASQCDDALTQSARSSIDQLCQSQVYPRLGYYGAREDGSQGRQADILLRSAVQAGGATLVLGSPGSGKTSLLAHLVDGHLDHGDTIGATPTTVWFLCAYETGSDEEGWDLLEHLFTASTGLPEGHRPTLVDWLELRCSTPGQGILLIVWDGIGQARRRGALADAIRSHLLPWVADSDGAIRLVVSARSDSASQLTEYGSPLHPRVGARWRTFPPRAEVGAPRPYLDLDDFGSVDEARADIQGVFDSQRAARIFHADRPAVPDDPHEPPPTETRAGPPYALLDPDIRRLLSSPIHVALYFRSHSVRREGTLTDPGELLQGYLQHIERELHSAYQARGTSLPVRLDRLLHEVLLNEMVNTGLNTFDREVVDEWLADLLSTGPCDRMVGDLYLNCGMFQPSGVGSLSWNRYEFRHGWVAERLLTDHLMARLERAPTWFDQVTFLKRLMAQWPSLDAVHSDVLEAIGGVIEQLVRTAPDPDHAVRFVAEILPRERAVRSYWLGSVLRGGAAAYPEPPVDAEEPPSSTTLQRVCQWLFATAAAPVEAGAEAQSTEPLMDQLERVALAARSKGHNLRAAALKMEQVRVLASDGPSARDDHHLALLIAAIWLYDAGYPGLAAAHCGQILHADDGVDADPVDVVVQGQAATLRGRIALDRRRPVEALVETSHAWSEWAELRRTTPLSIPDVGLSTASQVYGQLLASAGFDDESEVVYAHAAQSLEPARAPRPSNPPEVGNPSGTDHPPSDLVPLPSSPRRMSSVLLQRVQQLMMTTEYHRAELHQREGKHREAHTSVMRAAMLLQDMLKFELELEQAAFLSPVSSTEHLSVRQNRNVKRLAAGSPTLRSYFVSVTLLRHAIERDGGLGAYAKDPREALFANRQLADALETSIAILQQWSTDPGQSESRRAADRASWIHARIMRGQLERSYAELTAIKTSVRQWLTEPLRDIDSVSKSTAPLAVLESLSNLYAQLAVQAREDDWLPTYINNYVQHARQHLFALGERSEDVRDVRFITTLLRRIKGQSTEVKQTLKKMEARLTTLRKTYSTVRVVVCGAISDGTGVPLPEEAPAQPPDARLPHPTATPPPRLAVVDAHENEGAEVLQFRSPRETWFSKLRTWLRRTLGV